MFPRLSRVFCVFAKFENNTKSLKIWPTSIDHRFFDIDGTGTRLPPNDAAHRAESFGGGLVLQKSKTRIFGAITSGAAPRRRRRRGAKAGPAGPKKNLGGVLLKENSQKAAQNFKMTPNFPAHQPRARGGPRHLGPHPRIKNYRAHFPRRVPSKFCHFS